MTNDHNDWNSWSLCFMLAASMFHVCGLYVSCLRPLSTIHGYDKGRIAFWGARKRLGALAVFCGFERRACNTGAVRRAWNIGAGFVLLDSCFSVVLLVVRSSGFVLSVVLFVVRAFGFVLLVVLFVVRSLGSCFLVVLFVVRSSVRAFGRSLGSCFWSFFLWFVLLVRAFGGSYVFFVRCFKSLRGVCGKVRGFLMQR